MWNELAGGEWKKALQVRVTALAWSLRDFISQPQDPRSKWVELLASQAFSEVIDVLASIAGAQPLPSRPRRLPAQAGRERQSTKHKVSDANRVLDS